MTHIYDHTDFTSDIIPKGFTEEMRTLVRFAISYGWRVRPNGMRLTLFSVTGNKTISLSASGRTPPIQRYTRQIEQYGSPLIKPVVGTNPEEAAPELARRMNAAEEKARAKAEPPPPAAPKAEPLRLLSEEPMIAHSGQGKGYPSETTVERKWSDGSIDYQCAKCDFTSTLRHGVRSHWQVHIREDEANRVHQDLIPKIDTEPHEPIYKPRRWRVEALAQALKDLLQEGLDWDDIDSAAATLAQRALVWTHEQTGGSMSEEREPMTAEEVLVRIRSLVDNGAYATQADRIMALESERVELTARVEEAERKAQQAEDTLEAFADLAEGVRTKGR
jgi:hypothetical protein